MKLLFTLTLLITLLTSCTTITRQVTDEPIVADVEGRTAGEVIDDNTLKTRLAVNLEKLDPRFEEADVDVHVNAGVVLLVGQVPNQEMISTATELLKDDPQIEAIHNHLSAEPNLSFSLKSNDSWLAAKTRSRLFTTDYFPSDYVEVVVEKGVVYLMGKVKEETARQAVQIASEVSGVQKVVMVFQIVS